MNSTQKLRELTTSIIANKTVLVRVDYNVPLKKVNSGNAEAEGSWEVVDDRRIIASLDTINFLIEAKAKIILISHLGRPGGKPNKDLSLKPVANHLKKLGINCQFVTEDNCKIIGAKVKAAVKTLGLGQILLLENLRFDKREKKNDPSFAKELASLADVYVNEAFSNCHREHASIVGIPKYLPAYAGLNLVKELKVLTKLTSNPERPFVAMLGGAKISDKVEAIRHLANIADIVLIGGGIANDFFKAEGLEIYRSMVEEKNPQSKDAKKVDYVEVARNLIEAHKFERVLKDGYIPLPKIVYPIDVVAAPSIETTNHKLIKTIDLTHDMKDEVEKEKLIYADIGPKTIRLYRDIISQAGTIFWNGPMGAWENKLFATGTHKIGCAVADADATTIVGGGDTIAANHHFGLNHSFVHISTGGGAALEFLSGRQLVGVKPLLKIAK